ncbi:hypothetical protein [Pedobacter antarcticus]|uniref:T9SS C-terminal target domain-containing protein n=2 Tax=Pedobacter antarcticus TaxID=34086 RepID=A0A1I2IY16_9SPHI|nr:hypothetical protein [Pedobacter antarcticus]SDM06491.1 hypothetical protein SAMN04488084_103459 [Pedobacter antarcticus]SFF46618.1 hypothetical protein SAMN03003324_04030 [Pedobacter antarcticus]
MKKQLLASALSLLVFFASCSKSENSDGGGDPVNPGSGVVEVTGDITSATTWSADKIYLLKGNVFVTNNVTLTIQPGTIIKGDKSTKGALIITRGAKIEAAGSVDKPIVFTSSIAAGARSAGDWGGLILLGKAKNNLGTSVPIEGISDATDKGKHGGTDDADNSGTLKYVRVEFAGIPLGPDNEINGITFGSVGSGTTVDYVQVYRSGDDAFEWFGGSVNAKHLIAVATWDDDFDTDNGYSGKIQFALAQRLASTADVSGSNGFESDNMGAGDNSSPQTSSVFSNVTIIGPVDKAGAGSINANYQHAAQIRRNSAISIMNSVFAGYTEGIFYDDTLPAGGTQNSSSNYLSGKSVFANNLILGSNGKGNQIKASNATTLALISPTLLSRNVFTPDAYAASVITDPYKYSADLVSSSSGKQGVPNFTVVAGSAAAAGADFSNAKLTDNFFEKVAYKGAFGTTDWTAGWASFNPQVLPYTTPGVVK